MNFEPMLSFTTKCFGQFLRWKDVALVSSIPLSATRWGFVYLWNTVHTFESYSAAMAFLLNRKESRVQHKPFTSTTKTDEPSGKHPVSSHKQCRWRVTNKSNSYWYNLTPLNTWRKPKKPCKFTKKVKETSFSNPSWTQSTLLAAYERERRNGQNKTVFLKHNSKQENKIFLKSFFKLDSSFARSNMSRKNRLKLPYPVMKGYKTSTPYSGSFALLLTFFSTSFFFIKVPRPSFL